jgi:hypothetical protein
MDKPSYYAIIPATVRYDKRLTPNAKLLYGEITALCNQEGYCWAGNQYFADLYGVSKTSISAWIGNLKEAGHITVQMNYKEGSKHILNRYIRLLGEGIQDILPPPIRNLTDPIQENFVDNSTINTTVNTTVNNVDDFDSFWKFYPRKAGKDAARKAWEKLRPEIPIIKMIADNVRERVEKGEWRKDNQSFILHASTYLNQKRWEDEVVDQHTQTQTRTNPDSMKSISVMEKITDRSWAE